MSKDLKNVSIHRNFVPNNHINPIATFPYVSLNSNQNIKSNSNINSRLSLQTGPYTNKIQTQSFQNDSIHQSFPIQNQLQMAPQLSLHKNKTISLKNKHAIEAKRYSPIKVNNFHFMANNLIKNPMN